MHRYRIQYRSVAQAMRAETVFIQVEESGARVERRGDTLIVTPPASALMLMALAETAVRSMRLLSRRLRSLFQRRAVQGQLRL